MIAIPVRPSWLTVLGLSYFVLTGAQARAAGPATIDFARQVRPILSEHCFACHGPDEKQRKAKLRLDTKEGAFAELRGGGFAIVPGKPEASALIDRLVTPDTGRQMPPPKFNKKLSADQVQVLRQWVAQGAPWSEHWAFAMPKRSAVPTVPAGWARNDIDRFIQARLLRDGLAPSAEAERATLLRRVTLDLTGLPPTTAELDAFLADPAPDAYEKQVERLLRSPRHGEHLARFWLDAARYGDTHGLHLDNYREMWPYRDWVIRSFNANMPFDRFVVEQLAGDLLPNATLDQVVATGFNRCHVTTSEGGSIEEEIYVRNVVDQVDTNGMVFLGLSTGCARCHDHKYDPIRMKDYYGMFAFFNSIDGGALDGNTAKFPPVVQVPNAEQTAALRKIDERLAALRQQVAAEKAKVKYDATQDAKLSEVVERADHVWIDDGLPTGAKAELGGMNLPWNFVGKPEHPVHSGTKATLLKGTGPVQQVLAGASPPLKIGPGDVLFAYVYLDPLEPPPAIMLQFHSKTWSHRAYWGDNVLAYGTDGTSERRKVGPLPATGKWVRLEVEAAQVGLKPGTEVNGWAFTQLGGIAYWDRAGLETFTAQPGQAFPTLTSWVRAMKANKLAGLPQPLQDILKLERDKRSPAQQQQLIEHFVTNAYAGTQATLQPLLRDIAAVEQERTRLDQTIPITLVFKERAQPRPAYMLKRGEYDQRGDAVERGTPAFLPPLPADAPRNRLGFARWLVAPEHPLTARVAVNRWWQQFFGTGLVKTAEDFGSQGEPPTHPELLDWLAVQFREDGWDVRQTLRRIVNSATYRQSSRLTADRQAKDPANRLLSRGPRFRLDAEMLRDQALFAAGLLVEKQGGPSVKPPQPSGLWEAVGYVSSNTRNFVADAGPEKVHRRSLYTFWKRTAHSPQMSTFDAPSREACQVRRERTNTPLQALLLLNETQYVECAGVLAERAMKEAGPSPADRLNFLFRLVTARKPDVRETTELLAAFNDHLAVYRKNAKAAAELIGVGESKADPKLDVVELAAWTLIGNLVLNLDEVVNKG